MRRVAVTWQGRRAFAGQSGSGHPLMMDSPPPAGDGSGPTPKELVLLGMGGCTGIDVVDILERMDQAVDSLQVELECEDAEHHPKVFRRVRLTYRFAGHGLDPDQVLRAVELSMNKFCGVSAMIAATAEVTWTIEVNGQRLSD